MSRAKDYVKMDSLAEVYELCQKRSSLVVDRIAWLKMTNVTKRTIMDLSGPGLDQIEETGEEFRIGRMNTLRQIETHQGLNQYFSGIFGEYTRHTMGVQMRDYATMGRSIYSRLGFSDTLACMTALDTYVELYHGGIMSLSEFAKRSMHRSDKDILVCVIIKKNGRKAVYATQRNSSTDFPPLACCVFRRGSDWHMAVGARPSKAQAVTIVDDGCDGLAQLARKMVNSFTYGTSTRGSSRYRRQLASVYIRRLMGRLTGRNVTIG